MVFMIRLIILIKGFVKDLCMSFRNVFLHYKQFMKHGTTFLFIPSYLSLYKKLKDQSGFPNVTTK